MSAEAIVRRTVRSSGPPGIRGNDGQRAASGDPTAYALTVLTIVALVLALLFLPSPWGLIAVIVAAVIDVIETAGFVWWSKRRRRLTRVAVGVDDLIGRTAVAATTLAPEGQVRIQGEVWAARSATRIDRDARVVVRAVDGLVLVVEPADGLEAATRATA